MKKPALLILSSVLLLSNTCSIYASDDLVKILENLENKEHTESSVSETKNEVCFNIEHSFINEEGIMYYDLEYANELLGMSEFYYGLDNKTGTAYIFVSVLIEDYPNFMMRFLFKDGESIVKCNAGDEELANKVIIKDNKMYIPLRKFLNMFAIDDSSIIYNSVYKSVYILNTDNIQYNFRKKYYNKILEMQAQINNYSNLLYCNKDISCSPDMYVVYDDIYYNKGSLNARSIAEYIKNNIDSTFDLSDYTVSEFYYKVHEGYDDPQTAYSFSYKGDFIFYTYNAVNIKYNNSSNGTEKGYVAAFDDDSKVVIILPYEKSE